MEKDVQRLIGRFHQLILEKSDLNVVAMWKFQRIIPSKARRNDVTDYIKDIFK